MYALVRSLTLRAMLIEQLPVFAIAWVIAEFFYKFKSFTLECAAFLLTWFLLDAAVSRIRLLFSSSRGPT
ncbi:MAG: hypothetical protein V7704_03435 [Aurantimonas endophytica]|uniref:Uncharacterized protein n=1 Tax=Aurantimonas endophytica TaxID=1522175 RepID=A0A7W6HGP3_9HYPH|nr:hypothetical protein [Aurantimonas endophytica]MBB4004856.1 hypothetical protein [Aurantimonas endophytica]MCO6405666.1 hypothetical protein [Aurantimonas endophytica]